MQEYFAEVSLPIRELVEFVLASGSIDNRYGGGDLYQRANEGSRLHRKLQRQSKTEYGDRYHSEVAVRRPRGKRHPVPLLDVPTPSSPIRKEPLLRKSKPLNFLCPL